MMFALAMGIATANAQENVTVETPNRSDQLTLTKEVYPQKDTFSATVYEQLVSSVDIVLH